MGIDDLLDRLEQAEKAFTGTEFLAPIIRGRQVQVRVAGIVCQLDVGRELPEEFSGWAILRALSTSEARFIRPATMAESDTYIRLFPFVRMILVHRKKDHWLAIRAFRGDRRFKIEGYVPIWFPREEANRFDTVLAGFDGRHFWYRDKDMTRNPALAAYLREQFLMEGDDGLPQEPESLHKSGLSAEEREAYALAWGVLALEKRDQVEERLRDALAHAGAELRDYQERGDAYVVSYEVDGRDHTSTIRQDDLSVMTAGICLAGQDRLFDLASLVGVLREAESGHIVWVGENALPEEQYRQIHPPQDP